MTNVSLLLGADNEIFIDQSGATSNLDIEQVGGSGNIIGGSDATAGASNMKRTSHRQYQHNDPQSRNDCTSS